MWPEDAPIVEVLHRLPTRSPRSSKGSALLVSASLRQVILSPTQRLPLVLLIQPRLQRREVIPYRRSIRLLPIARMAFNPRPASLLSYIKRRLRGSLRPAIWTRAMKLELHNGLQKVAHLRNIGGYVLRGGIEIRLAEAAGGAIP
jgi:hypothetical protein